MKDALEKAKKLAGGAAALARLLNEIALKPITPQAVTQWDAVPPARVLEVERVTGVSRHELRPDFYPPPEKE